MPAPFYAAIKGTTAGAPGTGAFTPNAAVNSLRAWSNVYTGWMGLVRFDDVSAAWEETWVYWNGTTLSRSLTQVLDSSTPGSQLSLTSAATAAMVVDPCDVQSHLGSTRPWGWYGGQGTTGVSLLAAPGGTTTGTASAKTLAGTNLLTAMPAVILSSATTANAQCGYSQTVPLAIVSTSAGIGGFEYLARFGSATIPTGPRLFAGMTDVTFVANTGEPSALTANVAVFAKDSTDTNIQLLVNSNAGSGTKTDTGIALAANGVYEARVWCEPGSNKVCALLFRLDTGAIWFGSTTTDVPATGALMFPQLLGGLSGTTGTAFVLHFISKTLRAGP